MVHSLSKTVCRVPQNIKNRTLYNPAILLLAIYLKKTKILIRKSICIPMFTATVFMIAKLQSNPRAQQ